MKILVPFDGSTPSRNALQHAMSLALGREDVRVHLINVQEPAPRIAEIVQAQLPPRDWLAEQQQVGHAVLAPAQQLLAQAGLLGSTHVASGDPARHIAEHAASLGCDAIVMGTRGLGAIGQWMLGSVANKVVHLTTLPVTLVR